VLRSTIGGYGASELANRAHAARCRGGRRRLQECARGEGRSLRSGSVAEPGHVGRAGRAHRRARATRREGHEAPAPHRTANARATGLSAWQAPRARLRPRAVRALAGPVRAAGFPASPLLRARGARGHRGVAAACGDPPRDPGAARVERLVPAPRRGRARRDADEHWAPRRHHRCEHRHEPVARSRSRPAPRSLADRARAKRRAWRPGNGSADHPRARAPCPRGHDPRGRARAGRDAARARGAPGPRRHSQRWPHSLGEPGLRSHVWVRVARARLQGVADEHGRAALAPDARGAREVARERDHARGHRGVDANAEGRIGPRRDWSDAVRCVPGRACAARRRTRHHGARPPPAAARREGSSRVARSPRRGRRARGEQPARVRPQQHRDGAEGSRTAPIDGPDAGSPRRRSRRGRSHSRDRARSPHARPRRRWAERTRRRSARSC